MAAQNQLSSAEVQELIKYLQIIEGLQEAAAKQEANRIASTATAKRQLALLRDEYHDLTDDISDSLKTFKNLVSELGNASSGVTITTRAYKGIISVAEKLQLHQKSIVDLNEKDLKKLQEKLAIQRQNLINSKEVLEQDKERLERESQFKNYDKARVDHEIEILKQKQTRRGLNKQEENQLKQLNKENNSLERQLKNINIQLVKAKGYLAEMPGIEQGVDENFRAIEKTILRIQAEIKEQNSLLGLGGSIIAGLGTALDKLGFGKLSQILGISQATSEMEEFSSKIVKKRSEEANLRNSIERTQQELESKGYTQVLQNLEREKFLEEEIAKNRGKFTDAQIKTRFGGTLKNQVLELEALKNTISEKDRELHQKAQINNQNKVTLGQLAAQNAQYAGISGHIAVLGKGIKSMGSSLFQNLTNPISLATFAVTQLVDAFKTIDSNAGKLAKGMNISYGEALKVNEQFANIAKNSDSTFVTTKKLGESYLAISQNLGANVKIAEKDLETFTKLREQAGFTNEELIGINKISMATGRSVEDTVAGFMGAGKALAIQKGLSINIKQLMKETANVSNAIKLSLGATPEALAKAAVKVKELGINLEQADKIANSLLQFESSITAELEAELLTGKEINLENARYYALMGDIGSMAEEINKEIGGSAEFTKMNRIQQEAYAKAVGMSREELANSLVEQEALSKLGRSLSEEEKNAYEFAKQRYGEEKAAKMLGEGQLDVLGSMLSGFATLLSNTTLLKGILVGLGIAMLPMVYNLAAAALSAAALAISAITTASAVTLGLGALAIGAGIAVAAAAMHSETSKAKSQYTVKDAKIDRKKGVTLSGDFGEVQLDGNDQVYDASKGRPIKVGTDLVKESPLPSASNPIVASAQSVTATSSLGMPSSPEESQQLNASVSKLTETSQLQIEELRKSNEELKKSNQENKAINEARSAREEKTAATQTKSSSTQVTLLTKIAKILETQLIMSVAKDAAGIIPFIGGAIGGIASAGIGGKALYDLNQTPEETKTQPPKLADGGLVTKGGMAQVDTGEVYLGKNSLETLKSMSISLDKISNNTTNKLSATKTLDKTTTDIANFEKLNQSVQETKNISKDTQIQTQQTQQKQTSSSNSINLLTNLFKTKITSDIKAANLNLLPLVGPVVAAETIANTGRTILDNLNSVTKDSKDSAFNKSNYDLYKSTTTPKLAEGGSVLQEGIAKVDKNEIFLGKNSSEVFKDMYVSLNKISDSTNKLSATSTLNKANLTSSLLSTINKVFVDDVVNSETQKIKEENYLTTNNNLQPTPLNNTLETKLVAAPVATSNITTNNNGVSTITNNTAELTALLTKLDQLLQVNKEHKDMYAQYSSTPSKITLDGREFATIQNINTSRA